jgi:hypothetical protein
MDAPDAPPLAWPPPTRELTTDRLTCDGGPRHQKPPPALQKDIEGISPRGRTQYPWSR